MDHIRERYAAAVRGLAAERLKDARDIAEVLGCSRRAAWQRWRGERDYLGLEVGLLFDAWEIDPELLERRVGEAPVVGVAAGRDDEVAT